MITINSFTQPGPLAQRALKKVSEANLTRKNKLEDIKAKIEQENLEQELKETPQCALATILHEHQCNWNHNDGCSWHYNTWEDPGHERKTYLTKANNLLNFLYKYIDRPDKELIEIAEEIIEILNS